MPPKFSTVSLERTDSTGNLNVFLVLEKKINNDLMIISRDELPPTLRSGKLTLKQKITLRNADRQTIEGTIIFIHPDRDVCLNHKKQLVEERSRQPNNDDRDDSSARHVSQSQIIIGEKTTQNGTSKRLTGKSSRTIEKPDMVQPIARSTTRMSTITTSPDSCEGGTGDPTTMRSVSHSESPSVPRRSNQHEAVNQSLNYSTDLSSTAMETNPTDETDYFLQKINQLSLRLNENLKIIKQQEAEIKRLKMTSLAMPTDQSTRDYIVYMADKVRQQTTKYQYSGNLAFDSKRLGISVEKLTEILKSKVGTTSIARELFKSIVPEHRRQVDHWNKLEDDVLLKEKLLIEFLERYFGPLEINAKRIHVSIVGSLRNERGLQKRKVQQSEVIAQDSDHDETNYALHIEETDDRRYSLSD